MLHGTSKNKDSNLIAYQLDQSIWPR